MFIKFKKYFCKNVSKVYPVNMKNNLVRYANSSSLFYTDWQKLIG